MRLAASIFGISVLSVAFAASGQDWIADSMDLLREKLKVDKKLVIDSNLSLTRLEAEKFWPMYEDYQKELDRLNRRLEALIRRYAESYHAGTLDDATARELLQQAIAIGKDEIALDEKYIKRLNSVIPTIQTARYIQMENKIRALFKYELSAQIPLIE